jgi:hypothetical protein
MFRGDKHTIMYSIGVALFSMPSQATTPNDYLLNTSHISISKNAVENSNGITLSGAQCSITDDY